MPEPLPEREQFLELDEEAAPEHLDEQVQRAQEQLLSLRRQQELIEKQKRELEELSRKQDELQTGRAEMIDQFTRALVTLDRESYDARKRVEQLNAVRESFEQHLSTLEQINPKAWDNADINRDLTRALSAVEDARGEFASSRAIINAQSHHEILAAAPASDAYSSIFGTPQNFGEWVKCGFAFTLPLIAAIALAAIALLFLAK